MRNFALIGAILLILLPFTIIRFTSNIVDFERTDYNGFLFYREEQSSTGYTDSKSGTFNSDWLNIDGRFGLDNYFGENYQYGIFLLFLLIATIGLAGFGNEKSKIPAIMLVIAGILLLTIRYLVLDSNNSFFYDKKTDPILNNVTEYIELPIGVLIAIIFGVLDIVKGQKSTQE